MTDMHHLYPAACRLQPLSHESQIQAGTAMGNFVKANGDHNGVIIMIIFRTCPGFASALRRLKEPYIPFVLSAPKQQEGTGYHFGGKGIMKTPTYSPVQRWSITSNCHLDVTSSCYPKAYSMSS